MSYKIYRFLNFRFCSRLLKVLLFRCMINMSLYWLQKKIYSCCKHKDLPRMIWHAHKHLPIHQLMARFFVWLSLMWNWAGQSSYCVPARINYWFSPQHYQCCSDNRTAKDTLAHQSAHTCSSAGFIQREASLWKSPKLVKKRQKKMTKPRNMAQKYPGLNSLCPTLSLWYFQNVKLIAIKHSGIIQVKQKKPQTHQSNCSSLGESARPASPRVCFSFFQNR